MCRRPTRASLVNSLWKEIQSRRGFPRLTTTLLTTTPEEILPETVSPLPHPGQAHHAEGSAGLRVSPLTAVAPSPGTTSSTNQHRMPADAERLASAPAIDSGSSDSPSRAVPPTELPLGSTSTENGVCDAGSGISFPTSAHISTDLPARSSVVTALPSLTQGLTTICPRVARALANHPTLLPTRVEHPPTLVHIIHVYTQTWVVCIHSTGSVYTHICVYTGSVYTRNAWPVYSSPWLPLLAV